ncbi:MAG: CRISPR-associated protein Cas4 [Bacteroidetes bacterium]|nr:MAG: CRISPR-associated protein Cas4 [Bacteroidota bacterium]
MFSLTPSHIIEYLYCPRYTFFEYVLRIPQREEKYHKVLRGREIHRQKGQRNQGYLRRRLGVVDKYMYPYLTNGLLRGEVDEVLIFSDGTMAPLDYKFAIFEGKIYDTYKIQLYCYSWLIMENFGVKVEKGFLVYIRSAHRLVEVPVTEASIASVRKAVSEIRSILEHNRFPKATKYKKRCLTCTYRNICIK